MSGPTHYGAPIDLATAKKIMAVAEAECEQRAWPMAIAIVDSGANLVMLHKMDNTQYASIKIAQHKAEAAINFRRSTKVFDESLAKGGANLRILNLMDVSAVEGGVPIIKDGQIIGAIGVSGMKADEDGEIAEKAAAAI